MRRRTPASTRVLPDGTRSQNRLLAALPAIDYNRIAHSSAITTTVRNPDENTYWRCHTCGEIWNVSRRRPGRVEPRRSRRRA